MGSVVFNVQEAKVNVGRHLFVWLYQLIFNSASSKGAFMNVGNIEKSFLSLRKSCPSSHYMFTFGRILFQCELFLWKVVFKKRDARWRGRRFYNQSVESWYNSNHFCVSLKKFQLAVQRNASVAFPSPSRLTLTSHLIYCADSSPSFSTPAKSLLPQGSLHLTSDEHGACAAALSITPARREGGRGLAGANAKIFPATFSCMCRGRLAFDILHSIARAS